MPITTAVADKSKTSTTGTTIGTRGFPEKKRNNLKRVKTIVEGLYACSRAGVLYCHF